MHEHIVTDKNGNELIIQHRKSAVFFLKKYKDEDIQKNIRSHNLYIDGAGLGTTYTFTANGFKELYDYLVKAGAESWKDLNPRIADSLGADYDDYYDKEFDNNGTLRISRSHMCSMYIEGPYTQPPNKEHITRLIKFNKRKFESFIYDLAKKVNK